MIETIGQIFAVLFGVFFLTWLTMVVWGSWSVHKFQQKDCYTFVIKSYRDFKKFSEDLAKYSDKFGADEQYPNEMFLGVLPDFGSMFSKTSFGDNFYIHAGVVCINGQKYIAKNPLAYWKMIFILRKMYSQKVANKEYSFRYFGRIP